MSGGNSGRIADGGGSASLVTPNSHPSDAFPVAGPIPASPPDPSDPQVWWDMLLAAVKGYRRGDLGPAQIYLRFVEQHRGRPVAVKASKAIIAYAKNNVIGVKK